MDHQWLSAKLSDELRAYIKRTMVSLVAFEADGSAVHLGCGLLVLAQGARALVATAAHVLDFAGHSQQLRRAEDPGRPPLDVDRRQLRVIWAPDGENPSALYVEGFAVRANDSDVALLWTRLVEHEGDREFPPQGFAYDHRLPPVGHEVLAMFLRLHPGEQSVDGARRQFTLGLEPVLVRGRVSGRDPDGAYMGIGRNFTTTMPFPPGASGGAVLDVLDGGELIVLRGLITTSGFADPASYSDHRVAGNGRVVSAFHLLRLPIDSRSGMPLVELIRRGHFLDASGTLGQVEIGRGPDTQLRIPGLLAP